ncbi:MAG: GFA family protein [Proteobacteria bacterium]|nr:GFA family protein [Pseudomonadota bacterium]
MSAPFSGGCVCGAVRYECAAEPMAVAHCYCTDCQKTSGAQASTNLLVPKPAFKVVKGQRLKPGMSIYCDSAQPWAVIPEGIPHFPKMPPM